MVLYEADLEIYTLLCEISDELTRMGKGAALANHIHIQIVRVGADTWSALLAAEPLFISPRPSSSFSIASAEVSLGIRQSPRGDRQTEPTLTPSGRQDRLNC